MKSLPNILWGAAFWILTFSHGAHASLFGITFTDHHLIAINNSNAISSSLGTVAGKLGSELAGFGGDLYAFDQIDDIFRRINPADASTLGSTTAGFVVLGEGGMSFRSDGVLFLSNSTGFNGQLVICSNVNDNNTCAPGPLLAIAMDGFRSRRRVVWTIPVSNRNEPALLVYDRSGWHRDTDRSDRSHRR